MKRLTILLTVLCLIPGLFLPGRSAAGELMIALPASSEEYSPSLAETALVLSSGYTAADQRRLAGEAGFTVLEQKHFDKDPADPAHTCAYTIASAGTAGDGGAQVYLVMIRGTAGGEWYSNFDIAPSEKEDSPFAENFLFCAEDVFLDLLSLAGRDSDPFILITGHSRGAACANILGVLLNAVYGPERIYVYTSATPATVKKGAGEGISDRNIFNLIDPCDLVPRLPLEAWGYTRFGTDILPDSPAFPDALALTEEAVRVMEEIAPSVRDYYDTRHSGAAAVTEKGGVTAFELMLSVSDVLISLTEGKGENRSPAGSGTHIPGEDLASLAALFNEENASELLLRHLPDTYRRLFFGGASGREGV